MPQKQRSHTNRAWQGISHKKVLNFTSLVQAASHVLHPQPFLQRLELNFTHQVHDQPHLPLCPHQGHSGGAGQLLNPRELRRKLLLRLACLCFHRMCPSCPLCYLFLGKALVSPGRTRRELGTCRSSMWVPSSSAFILQGTLQQHHLKMLCEALPALLAGPSPGLGCYRGALTLPGMARLQKAPRLSQADRH